MADLGLAQSRLSWHLKTLSDAGVITGYRTEVDPRALGFALGVVLRVRPAPRQLAQVADAARDSNEVVECHRITGEDCFLLKVHAPSIADLETVLDQFLLYGQTVSSIVVSTPVPPRPLPVESYVASR